MAGGVSRVVEAVVMVVVVHPRVVVVVHPRVVVVVVRAARLGVVVPAGDGWDAAAVQQGVLLVRVVVRVVQVGLVRLVRGRG